MPYSPTSRLKSTRRSWNTAGVVVSTVGHYTEFPTCLLTPYRTEQGGLMVVTDQVNYGQDVPGWKKAIAMGQNATTTLTGDRRTLAWDPVDYYHIGNQLVNRCASVRYLGASAGISLPSLPSASVSPDAEKNAASNFLKSYLKEQVHFRGASVIAEFADTVKMLRHPIQSMYKHTYKFIGRVGKLRRVWRRNPDRYGELLSGAWLQYSFGVKPLLSDINEAANALDNLANKLGSADTTRIYGEGHSITQEALVIDTALVSGGFAYQIVRTMLDSSVRYVGAIRCAPPGVPAIQRSFGMDLADVIPAVWEAVPWSFLVDYFANINECLDGMRLATVDFAWLNRTVKNTRIKSGLPPYVERSTEAAKYNVQASGGTWTSTASRVTRTPMSSFVPYPSLQFKVPGADEFKKWLNMGALAHQIRRSKP